MWDAAHGRVNANTLMATDDKNTDCFLSTSLGFVLQVVLQEALEKQHQAELKQVMASFNALQSSLSHSCTARDSVAAPGERRKVREV